MDEGTNIRHLINGIKTDALNVIKASILASPLLQREFYGCVTLFKWFIYSSHNAKDTLNISNLDTDRDLDGNKGGGNWGGGGGGGRNKGNRGGGRGNGGRGRGNYRSKRGGGGKKRRRDVNDSDSSDVSFHYQTTK